MIEPRNYEETELLRNGLAVKVRAIRPADKVGLANAFDQLDPESIYTRFFQTKKSLSDQELKAATEVDFENTVALVVTRESGGNETIIGGGRYVSFELPGVRSAEIGFVVKDDCHNLGIAGCILKHLARIACQKGVVQFEAEVLVQNKAMLTVFSRSGLPVKLTPMEGVVHVTLSLVDHSEPR